MSGFLFKGRDGQTPLPLDLRKGLKLKHIQTMGELDEYEEENISEGLIWLEGQTQCPIDQYFWFQLHKKLFLNVWSWAGRVRVHELHNTAFLMPYDIRPALKNLENDLKFWMENKTFTMQAIATRLHERLLTIHPFANGNGRFSRILTEYFCSYYQVSKPKWGRGKYKTPDTRRKKYIEAIEKARVQKQYKDLEDFIFP